MAALFSVKLRYVCHLESMRHLTKSIHASQSYQIPSGSDLN